MKVSLNSLKKFAAINLSDLSVEELVERIGSQLGAIEEVINLGEKYQGIIIAKVVECKKLEGSDHLSVCKIDDGGKVQDVERDENGLVQVVCGAPNVLEGLTVAWLPPGTTVPESFDKDPFVLEAREIRGVKSSGMLASPRELALGDSHEGLLEIDEEVAPGTDFGEKYELAGDVIIDIENKMFTHRPDCFGFLGVARELAGIQHMPFKSPDWYTPSPEFPKLESEELKLEVKNELPELVPRFTAIAMSSIKVGTSPVWMQIELSKVGLKPINNIVDYTNYYMLLTGQPLHAYDYDKVVASSKEQVARIVVRKPRAGEKIKLLNGKEIEPRSDAIMIATDQKLIGIGGVMGGSDTEVDENTKNIILECATFDMYSIRRTSMENGLFTDAVTRFTKGQSPLQNLAVLAKIVDEIHKSAKGKVASEVFDAKGDFDNCVLDDGIHQADSIGITEKFINDRLGLQLTQSQIATLLENVEFKVEANDEGLEIYPPFWRMDVEIVEDVVEEVGRLYGFDKLPLELPRRSIKPAKKDVLLELKGEIRATLAKAGANEVLTYSFVHGGLLEKVGQNPENAFQISNALSPDLQYYRLSLTPSLLDKVHANIKAGFDEFAIFELGKAHIVDQTDDDGLPREDDLTSLVVVAADKLKKTGAAYYGAKKYLEALITQKLTYKSIPEDMQGFDITKPFDMKRSAFVYTGETFLGIIGEFRQAVIRGLKLPKYCAGFELDTAAMVGLIGQSGYTPLPRFPKVTQDITLKVAADLPYADLLNCIETKLREIKPENSLLKIIPLGSYQKDDDTEHKQLSFRITLASYERTLTDAEVTKLLDEVASTAQERLKAQRI